MVNTITNISTLLNNSDDLLKGSNREAYRNEQSLQSDEATNNTVEIADDANENVSQNIEGFANELSQFIDDENLSLEFSKDKETDKMIMRLVNGETKEVVKQFPPEISLQIARILSQQSSGNIANAKV